MSSNPDVRKRIVFLNCPVCGRRVRAPEPDNPPAVPRRRKGRVSGVTDWLRSLSWLKKNWVVIQFHGRRPDGRPGLEVIDKGGPELAQIEAPAGLGIMRERLIDSVLELIEAGLVDSIDWLDQGLHLWFESIRPVLGSMFVTSGPPVPPPPVTSVSRGEDWTLDDVRDRAGDLVSLAGCNIGKGEDW